MDGPAPRYIVFDNAPQIKGLGCTADELAAALRVPLAVVGVRVVRQPNRRGFRRRRCFRGFKPVGCRANNTTPRPFKSPGSLMKWLARSGAAQFRPPRPIATRRGRCDDLFVLTVEPPTYWRRSPTPLPSSQAPVSPPAGSSWLPAFGTPRRIAGIQLQVSLKRILHILSVV